MRPERQVGRVQRHRRWTSTAGRVRAQRSTTSPSRNGELVLPIDNGSIYQGGTSAGNIITQPTPSGAWTVTAEGPRRRAQPELPAGRPARVLRRRQLGVGAHDLGGRQRASSSSSTRTPATRATSAADNSRPAAANGAAGLLRADPLGRHQPHGVVLVRRRHVHARRPAGAAEHVLQPADRPGRAERPGGRQAELPTSTGSGSIRTPAAAAAAVAVAADRASTSSTAPTSRLRRGRSCAATRR